MKSILFITWDGPQTNYMEGLFLPLFNEIQKTSAYQFHIIQFTWGSNERIINIKQKANEINVFYTEQIVNRKPTVIIGSLISLYKGTQFIENYIALNDIDIVMPRSTMPAIMVNRIKDRKFELIFDADGLPLEERVDFSGLSPKSFQYKFLKKQETKMLISANGVLTRSKKAIKIHSNYIGNKNIEKFSVVTNGRDINFFKPNKLSRNEVRKELNVANTALVFVYCGSLGPQYSLEEMMGIFLGFNQKHNDSKFLILTGDVAYTKNRIPKEVENSIVVKSVSFEEVPKYLSGADIAFALRKPKYSMTAVDPIKIGEYLLMGLPTIASTKIGDSEKLLKKNTNCFLYNHHSNLSTNQAIEFIEYLDTDEQEKIRAFGVEYYSIEKSAATYIESLNLLK